MEVDWQSNSRVELPLEVTFLLNNFKLLMKSAPLPRGATFLQ